MYFKEVVPRGYKIAIIIVVTLVSGLFISISLLNPSNYRTLPFTCGFSVFWIIYSCYYFRSHSKIGLLENFIIVPKRGRYRGTYDVEGKVKMRNGKIYIPYDEIQEIHVYDNKVYLKYRGLLNFMSLEPITLEKFMSTLKDKIGQKSLNISISIEESLLESEVKVFKNNILSNIPTVIGFTIIMSFPNVFGIYQLVEDGYAFESLFFALAIGLVTVILYYSIYKYEDLIVLGDKELIKLSKYGNITLGVEKISYEKIKCVRKTKWRVDLKTKSRIFYLVPSEKDTFYKMINEKIQTERK